jgi:peptide/nickel transport system permease protein
VIRIPGLWRVIQLICVLLVVAVISFIAESALPLDAAQIRVGPAPELSFEERATLVAQVRKELGLNRSPVIQFGIWLENAATLNFGRDATGQPVFASIKPRLGPSAELALASFVLSFPTALGLALMGARLGRRRLTTFLNLITVVGYAIPSFWIGILLVLLFAVKLHWLPAHGYVAWTISPTANLRHLVLPAITLSALQIAVYYRYLREGLESALDSQFVRTARAKGIPEHMVLIRHALPNALLPVVTVLGMLLGSLFGGIIITESVFGWPGVGSLLANSAQRADYNTVIAIVMIIAIVFVAISSLVDLTYAYLDPRVRRRRG